MWYYINTKFDKIKRGVTLDYKTHRIGGICTGIITVTTFAVSADPSEKIVFSAALILGSYIGSLIPDLDHPKSLIGRKFKVLSKGINKTFGHRGITHTPLFLIIYSILIMRLPNIFQGYVKTIVQYFSFGTIIGYISHLILDFITVGGIPLLYPISKRHFRIARFRSSSHKNIITGLCIVITLIVIATNK